MPKATDPDISLGRLKELFFYDPEEGKFYWRDDGLIAGGPHNRGYWHIRVDGSKKILAHRLAWFYVYGEWPKLWLDHINRDKLDNRIENLRDVGSGINRRNAKMNENNKSKITGVHWHYRPKYGRWAVTGGTMQLGERVDFFEACCLRKSWEARNPL